jgi:hypothetical protein
MGNLYSMTDELISSRRLQKRIDPPRDRDRPIFPDLRTEKA